MASLDPRSELATSMVTASGLEKSYRVEGVETPVLHDICLDVPAGEWLAITGPSGCGKSTLLHLLAGLDTADAGSVTIAGRCLEGLDETDRALLRRSLVGVVFQFYNLVPHLSVLGNVTLPMTLAGTRGAAARRKGRELLAEVGLAEHARKFPGQLSGGQQQRVALARALANEPAVLLADEPTGALDSDAAAATLELIDQRHRRGQTIVLITHDHEVAARAERVVTMRDGRVVADRVVRHRVADDAGVARTALA